MSLINYNNIEGKCGFWGVAGPGVKHQENLGMQEVSISGLTLYLLINCMVYNKQMPMAGSIYMTQST